MGDVKKDERFAKIGNDPRFRRMQKKERKVKIDKRFKNMFTDKKFKLKYSVDKRGRPIQCSTNEDFRKYYDISDSEEDSEEEGQTNVPEQLSGREKAEEKQEHEEDEEDGSEAEDTGDNLQGDNQDESDESGLGSATDLARGEGNVETSSEEEDSNDEQEEDDDGVNIADLDGDAVEAEEVTRRLAVCNLDWDRVKAQDIFVLLQSFKPAKGVIKSVKIYPSDFGIERMKKEEVSGPTELTQKPCHDTGDTEEQEGDGFHTEKLRKYQLNRLRYYYAVVDCDSVETANQIYTECDGMEYESSSNKLDLRFIPDDMTFEHEPKAVCTELPVTYNPSLFFTTALCQSKVDLTWDETDHERLKVTMNSRSTKGKKGKNEVKEEDFQAYLASSSDEEESYPVHGLGEQNLEGEESGSEDEEKQISKYKDLLKSIADTEEKKKKKDIEMQITWEPGLKESTEKAVKKKEKEKDMTVWEKYLEKKKEKKHTKKNQKQKTEEYDKVETGDSCGSDVAAFSDDDVPGDIKSDPFFQQSDEETKPKGKKKDKKRRKKKNVEDNSEEAVQNKAALSLLMMDENEEDDKRHYSLKKLVLADKEKKKKKRKKGEDSAEPDSFQIDTADPRFEALYTSHMYNIDPSAPEYKKTKAMKVIVDAKQSYRKKDLKRKISEDTKEKDTKKKQLTEESNSASSQQTTDTSLKKLVESVKTKTKQFKNKR